MKIKKLCDLSKKEIEKHIDKVAALVDSPAYVCHDCCRVANCKKNLCKPTALPVRVKGHDESATQVAINANEETQVSHHAWNEQTPELATTNSWE